MIGHMMHKHEQIKEKSLEDFWDALSELYIDVEVALNGSDEFQKDPQKSLITSMEALINNAKKAEEAFRFADMMVDAQHDIDERADCERKELTEVA